MILLETYGVDIIIIASTALGSLIRVSMRWATGKENSHWTKEGIKILVVSIITHGVRSAMPICVEIIDCRFNVKILIELQKNESALYALFMLGGYLNREISFIATKVYDVVKNQIVDKIIKAFS